ncbi:hypothetical protein [Asaia prunellae]|uniref:hypothetical protein n=1 Tax=Asaia prunellae TaxID=610245 RepID=UPI000B00F327|nr:hypothetical protein [Asaia prunellae]
MMQSDEDTGSTRIRHLPVQQLLSPVQAAAYLGLAPALFRLCVSFAVVRHG